MAKRKRGRGNGEGKKKGNNGGGRDGGRMSRKEEKEREQFLHPETANSIWATVFFCVAIVLVLAGFTMAGPAGALIYKGLDALLGWGYFILPAALVFNAIVLIVAGRKRILGTTTLGALLLILSFLGIIEILSPGNGGWLGLVLGSLRTPFGVIASLVINLFILVISVLVTANVPLKVQWPEKKEEESLEEDDDAPLIVTGTEPAKEIIEEKPAAEAKNDKNKKEDIAVVHAKDGNELAGKLKKNPAKAPVFANYVPPPLSLLKSDSSKPTTGDLLANANVIKRTLESFGIAVEMGEINVGPAVTRYTLKPAEGVKLSRITALSPDLALSLAAHPIRIEAPIPGKSLVGIEVPNKAAALVRLGSLMNYPEFQSSGPLGFVLGRDVSGEPIFANIEKMPHMLVAGATGSGKSILVHSLITSLLYKNSPATLRLALIDPKRVELSMYDGIPHLITPVITENKKALGVLQLGDQRNGTPLRTPPARRQPRHQELQRRTSRRSTALHSHRHRRNGGPHGFVRPRSGRRDRAPGPDGARNGHPPLARHPAPVGGSDHGPHQSEHPRARRAPGGVADRLAHHSRRRRRRKTCSATATCSSFPPNFRSQSAFRALTSPKKN